MDAFKRKRGALRLRYLLIPAVFCLTLFVSSIRADSVQYTVALDTSAINGTSAQLAFDFISGGSSTNSVTVSGFSTDGTLGTVSPTGGVSGTLPGTVTLTDSSFFNEYLTDITLGTDISFLVSATNNPPASGFFPDAFSLSLLDPLTGLPLFATSDPTGASTLTVLSLDGSATGSLSAYTAPGGQAILTATSTAVPEPSTLLLMANGLAFLLWRCRARPETKTVRY